MVFDAWAVVVVSLAGMVRRSGIAVEAESGTELEIAAGVVVVVAVVDSTRFRAVGRRTRILVAVVADMAQQSAVVRTLLHTHQPSAGRTPAPSAAERRQSNNFPLH